MPEPFDLQLQRLRNLADADSAVNFRGGGFSTDAREALAELLRRWDALHEVPVMPAPRQPLGRDPMQAHEDSWRFTDEHGDRYELRRTGIPHSPLTVTPLEYADRPPYDDRFNHEHRPDPTYSEQNGRPVCRCGYALQRVEVVSVTGESGWDWTPFGAPPQGSR